MPSRASRAVGRAQEYLKKVDLPETLYKKMPSMISGGEQQRVAIARAIASGGAGVGAIRSQRLIKLKFAGEIT